MNVAYLITAKGRVQGVGFRYFVRQEAHYYGVNGYVKNLYNGDVEIFVEGDQNIIEKFTETIKSGPHYGEVTELILEKVTYEGRFDNFEGHF